MQFEHHIAEALAELERAGLRRRARAVTGRQGSHLSVDGRTVLCLSSNNYLGLAGDPALAEVGARALAEHGSGAGAARLISGSMSEHREAERQLAAFVARPDAVLFSSGYACNVGVVQALVGRGDVIFSDALNHASFIDGARLSRAEVIVYRHGDLEDLRIKLRTERQRGRAAIVLSESLFSMDGDIVDLRGLAGLAREHDAGLVIDDAHSLGVYGPEGRGLCAELGVTPDVLIGTLGKAFGGQGAFAAASSVGCELIRNRARSYVFSTAPAPVVAALASAALPLIAAADDRRAQLLSHAATLRAGLSALGYSVLPGHSPIIPVIIGDPEPTMSLSSRLFELGVFAHGIRPPTVPVGMGRLRVVPMATHSANDIAFALDAFAKVR